MSLKVTVLTLVYNGLPYLKYAIESTLAQTYTDFEYLIIDDASPDQNIKKFVESYKDPRIRFIRNDSNLGVSRTFNKALAMIKTPYIVRLDQDDVNLPKRVEEQISYLEKNKNVSIVCSWEHTINSKGVITRDWKRKIHNYGEFIGPIFLGLCPIWHPSIAFRKDDIINVGGFNSEFTIAEDYELTSRIALHRLEASILQKFHLLQRHHDNSQSKVFSGEMACMAHLIQKQSIANFIDPNEAEELAYFLKFQQYPGQENFDKSFLIKMYYQLNLMLLNASKDKLMTLSEIFRMKIIIYKRLGFGVYLMPFYKFLPQFLFLPLFYALSPLFSQTFHKQLSILYNFLHEAKYSIKNLFKQ